MRLSLVRSSIGTDALNAPPAPTETVRKPPYQMSLHGTLARFTPHLTAAVPLKKLLDEAAPPASARDRPVRGHQDRRHLNKSCLIESDEIVRSHACVPLHGSLLRGKLLLMSTPDDRSSLSWAAACVGLDIDRVVHLCPATAQARSSLMTRSPVASAGGELEATFTHRRSFQYAHGGAFAQHDFHVLLAGPRKGGARTVQVLEAPLLRPDRQMDPDEVVALLSVLPDGRAGPRGRLAVMAPHLDDEAAILAAAVDVTAAIDRRMARGQSLSDDALDDLVLEACVQIRSSCSADLFHHADQLATLRCVAHDWRGQQEREASREGVHRGRQVARRESVPAARYGATLRTWPPSDPASEGPPHGDRPKPRRVHFHAPMLSTTVKANHPTASALFTSVIAAVDFREDKPKLMSLKARARRDRDSATEAAALPAAGQAAGSDIASSR